MERDTTMRYDGNLGVIDPVTGMLIAQGIGIGVSFLFNRKVGQQKRSATDIVNEAERLLADNVDLYETGEISQHDALGNFDIVWGGIVANCSPLGGPGQRCITERDAGGIYDYFERYREPLLAPLAPAAGGAPAAAGIWPRSAAPGGSSWALPVIAALMVGGAFMVGGKA